MDADTHTLLRFVHILLFAYWLGADFGVFLGGGWMSRPGLTVVTGSLPVASLRRSRPNPTAFSN